MHCNAHKQHRQRGQCTDQMHTAHLVSLPHLFTVNSSQAKGEQQLHGKTLSASRESPRNVTSTIHHPAAAAAAQLCLAVRRAPRLHRVRSETLSPLLSFLISHEHTRARITTKTAHAQHRLPSPFPNLLLSPRRRRLHTPSVAPAPWLSSCWHSCCC